MGGREAGHEPARGHVAVDGLLHHPLVLERVAEVVVSVRVVRFEPQAGAVAVDGLLQLLADIRRALPRVLHDDRGVLQAGEDIVVRADQSLVLLHRVRLEVVAGRRLREPEVLLVVEHVVQMAGAEERALHVFIGDALFLDLRGGEPDAVGHIVRCARTFERECGHPSSF